MVYHYSSLHKQSFLLINRLHAVKSHATNDMLQQKKKELTLITNLEISLLATLPVISHRGKCSGKVASKSGTHYPFQIHSPPRLSHLKAPQILSTLQKQLSVPIQEHGMLEDQYSGITEGRKHVGMRVPMNNT